MTDTRKLRGVAVALVTPLRADGSLDLAAFGDHVRRQVDGGVSVLMPCGTTGESATLTAEEQRRVIAACVESADGRAPVFAGAGSNSTAVATGLARAAREEGADGILSVTPYYNKPGPEGLRRHFEAVAEAAELPVIVYNVPGRTGTNMRPETTLRLAEHPGVVGVKEASGDIGQIGTILASRPEGFLVLSGDDALTLPVLALGGDGVVSVAANEVPEMMARMVSAALEDRWEEARELHFRLLPLMEANFLESNPVPVKAALALLGRMEATVRPPLAPLSDASRPALEAAMDAAGLRR